MKLKSMPLKATPLKAMPFKAMPRRLAPLIFDTTLDYDESSGTFWARYTQDAKVYLPRGQALYADPDNGQIKTDWK